VKWEEESSKRLNICVLCFIKNIAVFSHCIFSTPFRHIILVNDLVSEYQQYQDASAEEDAEFDEDDEEY